MAVSCLHECDSEISGSETLDLGPDIMNLIFDHANLHTLLKFSRTCKKYRSDYVIVTTGDGDVRIKYTYHDIHLLLDWGYGEDLLERQVVLSYNNVRENISLSFDLPKVTHPFTRRILEKISEVYDEAPYHDIYYGVLHEEKINSSV
jgi:hypothetical protein